VESISTLIDDASFAGKLFDAAVRKCRAGRGTLHHSPAM
jgi:hypothetical protein